MSLQSDQDNCGACGNACGANATCSAGKCVAVAPVCAAPMSSCGAGCADLQTDPQNCGACGHDCGANAYCSAGQCSSTCAAPLSVCGSACVDEQNDSNHCGTCDTVCSPGSVCMHGSCRLPTWEPLANNGMCAATLSEFSPASDPSVYCLDQTTGAVDTFTPPDGSQAWAGADAGYVTTDGGSWDAGVGTWTLGVDGGSVTSSFDSLARVQSQLYLIDSTSVYGYDLTSGTWTTLLNATLAHDNGSDSQTVSDDQGVVYSQALDGYLIRFNPADAGVDYIQEPEVFATSEPRAAWDSQSQKLYLADYDSTPTMYSFDPADGGFQKLADFPDPNLLSDAFCSDHRGHIFTANSNCDSAGTYENTGVWMYTIATNTWTRFDWLPFAHSCDSACTVSADGWLYFTANDFAYPFARYKLY